MRGFPVLRPRQKSKTFTRHGHKYTVGYSLEGAEVSVEWITGTDGTNYQDEDAFIEGNEWLYSEAYQEAFENEISL